MTSERRAWLTRWKEAAVKALPSGSSAEAKVAVRRAVETALATFGPEDPHHELQDVVTAVVRQFRAEFAAEAQAQERDRRKQQLLDSVELWVDEVTLRAFPVELVGRPHSQQQRHVLATLRRQIRMKLAADLTGDESPESIVLRMQDELATWAVSQNPQVDRRTLLHRLAPWAIATLAGGIAMASWSPELKVAARTGIHAIKEKLTPYKPVAKAFWQYGLEGLTLWAQSQTAKKDPSDDSTPG